MTEPKFRARTEYHYISISPVSDRLAVYHGEYEGEAFIALDRVEGFALADVTCVEWERGTSFEIRRTPERRIVPYGYCGDGWIEACEENENFIGIIRVGDDENQTATRLFKRLGGDRFNAFRGMIIRWYLGEGNE